MSNDDNVVHVTFGGGEPPMTRAWTNPDKPLCRHRYKVVYEQSREVLCKTCGASLDPIECLVGVARNGNELLAIRSEIKREREELEDLERRVKNAKALVRKWERRAGGDA